MAALLGGLMWGGLPEPAVAAAKLPLQRQVNDLIQRLRAQGRIAATEYTAWSVFDFTSGQKLVAINEETPRQAASMIKPFVAQAFFFAAQKRGASLVYSPQVRDTMERMIRHSDNRATNEIMRLVAGERGPREVETVLKRHAPGVFRETRIVEYIPSGGRTYRNLASARDYSRFLQQLWLMRLPQSAELLRIMGLPNRNRMTTGVALIPPQTRVYHKTGSTSQLCGDMGIIECPTRAGQRHAYTFVGIIERPQGSAGYAEWIAARGNAIRAVSGLVYQHMKDRYQLV